jgi:cell shape-determining protein MreD
MRYYILIPVLFIIALIQMSWSFHWSIRFIVPNIMLAFLVVLTVRKNRRWGLIAAFIGGLFIAVLSPFPFSGEMLALLLSIGVVGILRESIFGNVSIGTLSGQAVIASLVFVLGRVFFGKLAFILWQVPLDVSWSTELINMLWFLVYQLALIWLFYLLAEWGEQKLMSLQKRSGFKRAKFF